MLHHIVNLDTHKGWYFQARTPYEAMCHLRYWLSCRDKNAEKCKINKTESGLHLYLIYRDETYSVRLQ